MSTYISGLITQQNPMAGGAVPFLQQKFYSATRYDRLIGGVNCELSVRLSMVRAPGSSQYNSQTFTKPNRFCSFKPIINNQEQIHVMVDTASNVYDGTGPSGKISIWNKSPGSGKTQFQAVGDELFFGNGIDQKKWVLSELIWQANTLYDGAATSDQNLGDFIIDTNSNIQQAVGGFTLIISNVQISTNVLTLTLDTSTLPDPSGTPTGSAATTGGALAAGNHFIRICGVDPTGNVTEAGNESAAVATTGTTGQINWTWPAIAGAVGYRIYVGTTSGGETTYFTSATNSFTQTTQASTVTGTPPVVNSTSVDVPFNLFLMNNVQLALAGLTTATFLNGQTIRITGVLPGGEESNMITAAFTHADYASTTDTGTATSGSGITAGTQPTWATALGATTQDGGAQWINRGSNLQNWGIASPAAAPTIYQSPAPQIYEAWASNTTYWPSHCIVESAHLHKLTTGGTTGSSAPSWNTSSIGATTTDGTAVWTYIGPTGWNATSSYTKGQYSTANIATAAGTSVYIYIAQNSGTSAVSQSTWVGGANSQVQDGSILWLCLGILQGYNFNQLVQIAPSRKVSVASVILDSNGYMQQIQDNLYGANVSGVAVPLWGATGAYTAETLSASVNGTYQQGSTAQISAYNVFHASTAVQITGLTTAPTLNGTWECVFTGLSPAPQGGFGIAGSFATSAFQADSGTATQIQGAMWLNIGAYAPVSTSPTYYAYAYKNSVTKHVGSASDRSAPVLLFAGNYGNVQGFGSADPQVDTIVIYRTAQGGSTLLEDDEIANPGGGVPFTYNDTNPDTALNVEVQAAIAGVNNPPPAGFLPSAYHLGRIWGFVNNKLIWSGGPDTLTGSGNEAFPPNNYFSMPEGLTKCRATSIGLLIYGTANVYIETGLGTNSQPFIPPPVFQEDIGLLSYDAECVNGSTTYLMTSEGRVISFDPGAGEVEVGFFIGDQFDTDFDPTQSYLTFHQGSSEDMGLYVADGSTGWYRMGILGAPESGFTWSPKRNIVGGCGAVQSVQVASGKGQRKLLIGAETSGPILMRDYSVYTDNAMAYPMSLIIGSVMLCQPGTVAEVDFVTLDSILVGTRPIVGLLLGELSGYATSPPFVNLISNTRDLPLLPAAKTLYSDRYSMAQNQNQQSCRHLQMSITWAAEAFENELLTHTIYGTLRAEG